MISLLKRLAHRLADAQLSILSRSSTGQHWIEARVLRSQHFLGIGSGEDVDSSGEKVALRLLRQKPPQGPLCVFDVGSNQGQFLKMAVAELAGAEFTIHSFEA